MWSYESVRVSSHKNLYLCIWVLKINSYQFGGTCVVAASPHISYLLQVESYLQLLLLQSLFQNLNFLLESRLGPRRMTQ